MRVNAAYIDGELCGVDDAGLPSFAQTHSATDGERGAARELLFWVESGVRQGSPREDRSPGQSRPFHCEREIGFDRPERTLPFIASISWAEGKAHVGG